MSWLTSALGIVAGAVILNKLQRARNGEPGETDPNPQFRTTPSGVVYPLRGTDGPGGHYDSLKTKKPAFISALRYLGPEKTKELYPRRFRQREEQLERDRKADEERRKREAEEHAAREEAKRKRAEEHRKIHAHYVNREHVEGTGLSYKRTAIDSILGDTYKVYDYDGHVVGTFTGGDGSYSIRLGKTRKDFLLASASSRDAAVRRIAEWRKQHHKG